MCCCKQIFFKVESAETCKYYQQIEDTGEFEVVCEQDGDEIVQLLEQCAQNRTEAANTATLRLTKGSVVSLADIE